MKSLDRLDKRILTTLQNNARISNSDLADHIGLSPSACLNRVKRLEEDGVIQGYTALLDPETTGKTTTVFIEITLNNLSEETMNTFEREVQALPDLQACYLMSGSADYLVHMRCGGTADYERVHRRYLSRLPGVARIQSSFALRQVYEARGLSLDVSSEINDI